MIAEVFFVNYNFFENFLEFFSFFCLFTLFALLKRQTKSPTAAARKSSFILLVSAIVSASTVTRPGLRTGPQRLMTVLAETMAVSNWTNMMLASFQLNYLFRHKMNSLPGQPIKTAWASSFNA